MSNRTKSPRIDSLAPGSTVLLRFGRGENADYEDAIFVGIEGSGDEREAKFLQLEVSGAKLFNWSAYRFRGRWVYGSSADPLAVEDVKHQITTGGRS